MKKKIIWCKLCVLQIPGQTLNFKMEFAMPVDTEK